MDSVSIRLANPSDAATIYDFIVGLAIYEREPDAVETSEAILREQMSSETPPFECLLAERAGDAVGFALFFQSYSTWRGLPGIYLEDLFVPEVHRGAGIGTALLGELARITLARGGGRLEWSVLDWNQPSIAFYENIGAEIRENWLPCRLAGATLEAMARRGQEATPG